MKRDMDLVREILTSIEDSQVAIPGWDPQTLVVGALKPEAEVGYHVGLLQDAGYVTAIETTSMGRNHRTFLGVKMTWEGHEFLDAVRSDTVWAAVKQKAAEQGGSLPLEIVKMLANALLKKHLGLG